MTALTNTQRVTVNAGLALLHAAGYDASAVTRAARASIAQGVPAGTAYGRAIDRVRTTLPPEICETVDKIMRLVNRSDEATVAQYDHAINSYNATGDETAIDALYPMMARDGVALALKDGEITQAEIDDGTGIAAAIGYEPMPEQIAALQFPAPEAAPAPQEAPQQFRPPAAPMAPQPVPSAQNGIVRDQKGVSYSSSRIAAPAAPAATAGVVRDQSGVSYSAARHGVRAEQWAAGAARGGPFRAIERQPVGPGETHTLEKAGAQFIG